jgi:ABC-2 type transport system permease protein
MLTRVWLIARREYVERIRTRGFIITTVLIPLLMCGFIFGSIFLGSKTQPDRQIAVVSADTDLVLDLQTELERQQRQKDDAADAPGANPAAPTAKSSPRIVVDAMNPGPGVLSELNGEIESGDIDGYLWIAPAASPDARPTFSYTSKSGRDSAIRDTLAAALDKVLIREQLAHRGIVASEMDAMLQPVKIVSAQSEVLLATVRPEAMMAGKIIGVGSVGLTQVGIWLLGALLVAASSVSIHLGSDTLHITLTPAQVFFFLTYFVLGYLFYSAIAAALGAMTNSEQELQQLNMFLMLPLLVCFFMLGPLISAPDSTLARVLALIPPFTPLIMYMRVSLGHPAKWEVALSLLLLSLSIYGLIWVTSRIYRVGVLMYGKRPSVPEILRWLRYS